MNLNQLRPSEGNPINLKQLALLASFTLHSMHAFVTLINSFPLTGSVKDFTTTRIQRRIEATWEYERHKAKGNVKQKGFQRGKEALILFLKKCLLICLRAKSKMKLRLLLVNVFFQTKNKIKLLRHVIAHVNDLNIY